MNILFKELSERDNLLISNLFICFVLSASKRNRVFFLSLTEAKQRVYYDFLSFLANQTERSIIYEALTERN